WAFARSACDVKFSRASKIALALALAATVSLKLFVRDTVREKPWDEVHDRIIAFLVRHGLEAHVDRRPAGLLIRAGAGDCRMLVAEVSPQGLNRDSVERFARDVGRLLYVFDGAISPEMPIARASLDHYWTRFLQRIGL